MSSNFTITEHQFWQNTMRSVENTYCWLTTLETQNYVLVDNAITALRKLITHGKTIEQVKNYKPSSAAIATPIATKKSNFQNLPVNYSIESNWDQVDDNTIHIDLGEGGSKAIAIAVTTEEMLDKMIEDIYNAPYIAVDCEFLGQKNALPELKLLQVGVSKEKGYAVQVDKIGVDIMTDKLKPILESEELNIIGWSFRSDALAIECYLKHVELSPVLDLQAKLKPIAVEQLNLSAAMNKFASDWVGNNEFQKAKQYGNQFNFTGENCIWVYSPLPPRALVYAVFDVLSVVALHEATMKYESLEVYYWPFTITKVESRKAVDNWHRLRAKGINSAVGNQGVVNIIKSSPSSTVSITRSSPEISSSKDHKKGKERFSSASSSIVPDITVLGDGYDDDNAQYKREIELAIEASKKDYLNQIGLGELSKPSGDRVISSEEIDYSSLAEELDATSSSHSANTVFSKNIPKKASNAPKIIPGSWGTEVLDDQPFIGTGKKFRIDNKEIDTSSNVNNDIDDYNQAKNTVDNRSSLNATSPSFASQRKRSSISSNISKSPGLSESSLERPFTPSPKQAEQSLSSTPQIISNVSPQHNKQVLASPPPSTQPNTLKSPGITKNPISRWNNEPTEINSQWDKQDSQQQQQESTWDTRSSKANSNSANWRKDISNELYAQWGNHVLTSENQENTTWGSTVDHTFSNADNQDDVDWNDNNQSNWSDKSSANEKQDTNQWRGNNQKATSNGWGGNNQKATSSGWGEKSESKSWQESPSSWRDRSNRTTISTSWNDNNRNNPAQTSNQWKDNHITQEPDTAGCRPPAVRASPRTISAPLPNQASPAWNTVGSPSLMKSSPSFKPDKAKYTSEFKNRISIGNQGGSFTNYKPVGNEMSSASWKFFASSTVQDWEQLGKDTPLDAIDKPMHLVIPPVESSEQSEPIKFNTVANKNYTWGGEVGDTSTGKMHDNDIGNSWTHNEDRPDTMQMPMNQIPIRKEFRGPRIMNPDDDVDSDDDDSNGDYDDTDFPLLNMNKMGGLQETNAPTKSLVHQLKTYVDGEFLYDENGNRELAMLRLTSPEHLDEINIPPPGTDFTVTIGYHLFTLSKDRNILKAIQLYLSTGESYTMVIEKCCYVNNFEKIKKTKFGQLVTDPHIKRICWFPQYIEEQMIEKVGFPVGRCVDLAYRANHNRDEDMSFSQAVAHYLKDWPDKALYEDAKKDFDSLNSKKFSSSCWDRDSLPGAVLRFSALQGLIAHAVYLETLKQLDADDNCFIYEYC